MEEKPVIYYVVARVEFEIEVQPQPESNSDYLAVQAAQRKLDYMVDAMGLSDVGFIRMYKEAQE